MLTVEEAVVIDRPRQEVFEFFADPDNVTVYNSNVVEYDVLSGQAGQVGLKARAVVRVAGRKVESTDELIEVGEGERIKLRADDAQIPYTLEISMADEGGSTKVTWHQEMESLKGVFRFADPVVLKMYSRDVRSNLDKAKTLLEA